MVSKVRDNNTIVLWLLFFASILFIAVFVIEEGFVGHIVHKIMSFGSNDITEVSPRLRERGFADLFTGLGAMFTFLAFFWQFKANKRQDEIHSIQSQSYSDEKTEHFFMELLKLIKDNTNNLELCQNLQKKRVYHYMYYEFTCILNMCRNICMENADWHKYIDNLYSCVYCIFIDGIFQSDNNVPLIKQNGMIHRTLSKLGYDDLFVERILSELIKVQKAKGVGYEHLFLINQYKRFNDDIIFFDGHRISLTHVTRTVVETIKYVETEGCLNSKKNYYYRLIASQMSDHEIFINVLHFYYMYSNKQLEGVDCAILEGYNSLISNLDESMRKKLWEEETGIKIIDKNGKLKVA